MKTIKVFIASSEELRMERLEFTDMIQQLNRSFKPRGIEIEPVKWESPDTSIGSMHKQEKYNRELKNCEMCLVLYWTKFGEYTESELNTAYTELCAGRNPRKLYVYFKDATDITPELQEFKDKFATNYGHFFCRFENVDTMRLNFLLQFEEYQSKNYGQSLIEIRNSKVEVDGEPYADLRQVPFCGNNPEYQQLLRDVEKAQQRVLKYPEESDFRQELHDLQERLEAMERSLLDTAKLITRLASAASSARLSKAVQLFEQGDNKGASAVLNIEDIDRDVAINIARLDDAWELEREARKALEINIDEYRFKIRTIQNSMEPGWLETVIDIYNKATEQARGRINHIKFADLLYSYAFFLDQNGQYHLIGDFYIEALEIYQDEDVMDNEEIGYWKAETLHNIARLYRKNNQYQLAEKSFNKALKIYRRFARQGELLDFFQYHYMQFEAGAASVLVSLAFMHTKQQQYQVAEKEYKKALSIYRKLVESDPKRYEGEAAKALNSFANLLMRRQQYQMAEEFFNAALSIRKRLAQSEPCYEEDVASTLSSLALLHQKSKQYQIAEEEYQEALSILKRLAESNPYIHEPTVAHTLNNLANLHKELQQYLTAEKEFEEALRIRENLAQNNPQIFNSKVAETLVNIATLYLRNHQYQKAEEANHKALKLYKELSVDSPKVYEPNIAAVLNNLGILYNRIKEHQKAEEKYNEALEIRRKLVKDNPQAFEADVAMTLYNLAILHKGFQQYQLAEEEYGEALDIYRRLAKNNPQAFEADVAMTLYNLAILHDDLQQYQLAEKEYGEALEIRRGLAKNNPQAFEGKVAETLNNLANLYYNLQQYQLAEEEYGEALTVYRRLAENNPQAFEEDVARTQYNLGVVYYHQDKERDFIQTWDEALQIYRKLAQSTDIYDEKIQQMTSMLNEMKS